jgi:hypothetical protein
VASARVTVERAKDYVGIFRAYWLVIDGAKVGPVKRGRSLTVDVEPGHHEVHLALDWTRSPSVSLTLGEREEAPPALPSARQCRDSDGLGNLVPHARDQTRTTRVRATLSLSSTNEGRRSTVAAASSGGAV